MKVTKKQVLTAYNEHLEKGYQKGSHTAEEVIRYRNNASDDIGFIEMMIPELLGVALQPYDVEVVENVIDTLTNTERKWLEIFQNRTSAGEFYGYIVSAFRVADLSNRRALAKGFPEIARGFELWQNGEYN